MLEFDTLKINLGLERVSAVLKELGEPQLQFKSIHVAGTNGKGSVCAMLTSILIEAGKRTGRFTSPHLFKWNERITVNSNAISGDELELLTTKIKNISKKLMLELTPFEIITCVAFQYFAEQKVEIAVIEVGMGGRLDATNVINPLASVITNVDLDHTEYLGKTLVEIANEKAGIIKAGIPVFTAEKNAAVLAVIRQVCDEKGSELFLCEAEKGLQSGLQGKYQRENEAVALKVAKWLNIKIGAIDTGLHNAKWPGRFQAISRDPLIIVDGAHNPAGAKALVDSLKELGISEPTFILGFQGYKDIDSMLDVYAPYAGNIIFTRSSHPQSFDPAQDPKYSPRYIRDIKLAIKEAKKIGNPIVIAGSLFVVADAFKLLDVGVNT